MPKKIIIKKDGGIGTNMGAVFGSPLGADFDLSEQMIRQARGSGQLNLTSRGLVQVPSKVWNLNESDPDERNKHNSGFSMDKVEDDVWWNRVDLTKLYLASNKLSNISSDVGKLLSLKVLDLHDNNIQSIPNQIGNLRLLERLNLSRNKIKSLPNDFFNLTSLLSFSIAHNLLESLSDDISRLNVLDSLELSHNNLVSLPPAIGYASHIRNLDVSHNQLRVIPSEISSMMCLASLDMSHNCLNVLPESLGDLQRLERLYVGYNQLNCLPALNNCRNLKELYLSFNKIEKLTSNDCENILNIAILDLRDNQIAHLPNQIGQLASLKRIDLSNNNLAELPSEFGLLPHLNCLQVEGNPLRTIRYDILQRGTLGLLKYLASRISDAQEMPNASTGLLSNDFPSLDSLKTSRVLKLSGKELSDISKEVVHLAMDAKVIGVDFSRNIFVKVPDTLEQLIPQLSELNFSRNRLESLPKYIGCLGIRNLQFIDVSSNRLSSLPDSFVELNSCLRELCLSFNQFCDIPSCVYRCFKLEKLLLSDNRISQISDVESLINMKSLAILDLSNNNIDYIPPKIGLMSQLRSLQLEGNSFRVPRSQLLSKGTAAILDYLKNKIPASE